VGAREVCIARNVVTTMHRIRSSTVNYDLIVFGRDAQRQSTDGLAVAWLGGGQSEQMSYRRDIGVVPDCLNQRAWRGLVTLTL
jgi:hypothetical protein